MRIWPQRIFVADMAGTPFLIGLHAEAAVAAEAPVDATGAARDAGDVLTELAFEGGRPGHELEAEC